MRRLWGFLKGINRRLTKKAWARFTLYPALFLLTTITLALVYWEQLEAWEAFKLHLPFGWLRFA